MKIFKFLGLLIGLCTLVSACFPTISVDKNYPSSQLFQSKIDLRYDHPERYSVGDVATSAPISKLDIDWCFDSVVIRPYDGTELRCSELNSRPNDTTRMRYWIEGATLRIRFSKSLSLPNSAFEGISKRLLVLVPRSSSLAKIEIESLSAQVAISDLHNIAISVESTSGNVALLNVSSPKVDVELTAGSADISDGSIAQLDAELTAGSFSVSKCAVNHLDAELTSGNFSADVSSIRSSDIECTAGNVDLFTHGKGFAARIEKTVGSVNCEVPCTINDGLYTSGNQEIKLDIESTAGNITIH